MANISISNSVSLYEMSQMISLEWVKNKNVVLAEAFALSSRVGSVWKTCAA